MSYPIEPVVLPKSFADLVCDATVPVWRADVVPDTRAFLYFLGMCKEDVAASDVVQACEEAGLDHAELFGKALSALEAETEKILLKVLQHRKSLGDILPFCDGFHLCLRICGTLLTGFSFKKVALLLREICGRRESVFYQVYLTVAL
jgi:hypothetical protein